MSDVVIKAEGLGKKYTIGHQAERERYTALRDVMARSARGMWHKTRDLLQGKPVIQGDTLEEVWALKDVDFEIRRGEAVGIIGRNGAGKSTLLKILSRITEPSAGRVTLRGRVASLLEVGTGFHPELTGSENIYLNGAILGMTRGEIKRKFDEIVDFAGVEQFLDTPVKRYSSGMYVRLAFAVAAHLEPEILVVDEVLAVGDAEFQKKCLGKMGDVASEGRTVLFVSHNMAAMQSLCRRAILLGKGKIVEDGISDRVVLSYTQEALRKSLTKQEWLDPESAIGNKHVRIRAISICTRPDRQDTSLSIDKDFGIEIQFWSLLDEQNLNVTLHVIASNGVVAFSTGTAHHPNLRTLQLRSELYKANCTIPAHLLNCGVYRIRLLIVKDQTQVVFSMDDALAFEVLDSAERRGAYFGERPGVVAPLCDWRVQRALSLNPNETVPLSIQQS